MAIGRFGKAGRHVESPVERFDPEGCKSPKGEWRLEETRVEPVGNSATGLMRGSGRNPGLTGFGG